ncbi:MFS transporter [Novosphingobium sp. RL4]|uniref:MFS transporter n=1 Tax=Novosphingobium sp. RL4 TaxID=3109595 RepID=UPI002D7A3790|nr:MFS transporter [Novosphingobium sp. RL4]WRT94412.1 MFS transporter [Novosphingobium sp. RL4]
MATTLSSGQNEDRVGRAAIRKIHWHILSFLFVVVLTSYVDRMNTSYAALAMNRDLGLTPGMFGFGAGIFFIGEALFAVPSSMAARRFGVHRWIPIMMIGWAFCAALMGAVQGPKTFYALRFALGVAEAGVVPSILIACSLWYPPAYRARAVTLIMAGAAVAAIVGAPLSAFLIQFHGLAGLEGWRWLFILEGVPIVFMGIFALRLMPSGPQAARWLTADERKWLAKAFDTQETAHAASSSQGAPASYISAAALVNLTVAGAASTMVFWIPKVGHDTLGLSLAEIGKIIVPLFVGGIIASYAVSHFSDVSGKRYPWVIGSALASACLTGIAGIVAPSISFYALALAFLIARCIGGIFMAALSEDLRGKSAATGFAIAMVAAGIGQFGGNWLFGVLKGNTGSYSAGLVMLTFAMLLAAGLSTFLIARRRHFTPTGPAVAMH